MILVYDGCQTTSSLTVFLGVGADAQNSRGTVLLLSETQIHNLETNNLSDYNGYGIQK